MYSIIFDCDGVLVDSEPLASIAYVRVFARHGLTISEDHVQQCIGMKQADILAKLERLTGQTFPPDRTDDIWAETREVFSELLQPMPGVAAFLEQSSSPRCVASSSSVERIHHSLNVTGLLRWFGNDIYSASMVQRGKPAPDLFFFAAEKIGARVEQCVVIEDSPYGVQGAVSAGMTAIGFTGGGHCQPGHDLVLREAGASAVFGTWSEIETFLSAL